MGRYIENADVEVRLQGKVRFTDDPETEPNMMGRDLLDRLIREAEGQAEMDLSPRYAYPFQTPDGTAFSNIPDGPTKDYLRTMCELMAVVRVLETDFGRGSGVDAEKFTEKTQKRYDQMVERALEKKDESNRWLRPPFEGLRLAPHNELGDTGYAGRILISGGDGHPSFPQGQINDPEATFFND